MEKNVMCLSREEQDSIRALAGAAEETVELSQSLYQAIIDVQEKLDVVASTDEPSVVKALKAPLIPAFVEAEAKS